MTPRQHALHFLVALGCIAFLIAIVALLPLWALVLWGVAIGALYVVRHVADRIAFRQSKHIIPHKERR